MIKNGVRICTINRITAVHKSIIQFFISDHGQSPVYTAEQKPALCTEEPPVPDACLSVIIMEKSEQNDTGHMNEKMGLLMIVMCYVVTGECVCFWH